MAGVSPSRLTWRPIALGIAFGVLAVVAAAFYFIALNHGQPIIRPDASAYYAYLRLYLIHHKDVFMVPVALFPAPQRPRIARQHGAASLGGALAGILP